MIFIPAGILYLGRLSKGIKNRGEKSRLDLQFLFLSFFVLWDWFILFWRRGGNLGGSPLVFHFSMVFLVAAFRPTEKAEACSEKCGSRS